MATAGLGKKGTEHEKKFPLPEIGEDSLVYKGIRVPLKGGHRMMFGFFSARLKMTDSGWESALWAWHNIIEIQAALKYRNEEAARAAVTKLNNKFRKFDEAGLVMRLKGDYRRNFHLTLTYKKLISTGTK